MSEKIEFYHRDEYKKNGTGIERTDLLPDITYQDFFDRYADMFFEQYCEQYIQETSEYGAGQLYLDTFSKKSVGSFLKKIAQEVVHYPMEHQWPLSPEQLHDFLFAMGGCINTYATQHKIDDRFMRDIRDTLGEEQYHSYTAYAYAAVKLFEAMGYAFDSKKLAMVTAKNSVAFALKSFFEKFLVQVFFRRTKEPGQASEEIHQLFVFKTTLDEYALLFMEVMLESEDTYITDKYIQWVYTLMKTWYATYWKAWLQRFVDSFNDVADVYATSGAITPQLKAELVVDVKHLFDHYFVDMLPKDDTEITVFMRNIWTTYTLLHKDNFYFDTAMPAEQHDEAKKITDVFGMIGDLYPWYRGLRSKKIDGEPALIQDANIFDDQGNKVRRWDIYVTDTDVTWLHKRRYILDQADGFFPEEWATIKEKSLPMYNALLWAFTKQDPTKMKIDYIRAKAKRKIENGTWVANTFLG